jgi:hypothetical protein
MKDLWPPFMRSTRYEPKDGAVGIVLPVRDDLRFFDLAFFSVVGMTDYPHMLTVVDNMSGFKTTKRIESIRLNHPIFVEQYQGGRDLACIWDKGLDLMFKHATVKYGLVMTPTVVVEPFWLSTLVRVLEEDSGAGAVVPRGALQPQDCCLFRREVYEHFGGFSGGIGLQKLLTNGVRVRYTDAVSIHKFKANGFDPKPEPPAKEEAQNAAAA